jgi:glutaminyl-tRNA synthetase
MTAGEMEDGSAVLRLKIDMSSPNINLRDPAIYRIKREAEHPQTGRKWKVYPMYDYAHSLNDALENITHSLCTTEFEAHRPLYDWVVSNVPVGCVPRQIEFSRLNLQYTVLSKRKLIQLVRDGHVRGWDDPRMPTLIGLRRRGVPAEAIRLFVDRTGVSKAENNIDYSVLEDCARACLDPEAPRVMAVLEPLKVGRGGGLL